MITINMNWSEIGFRMGLGFICALGTVAVISALGAFLVRGWIPTDDTDQSPYKRSGVELITDYGTGLQYLKSSNGSLTPRLGPDGAQMRAPRP